jgi:hypothetical protein
MVTTTIEKSSELNVDRLIQQPTGFEAALYTALEEVGERFGLYEIIRRCGPVTPACLGTQAGISPQAARIWLDAQAAGRYLNYCPGSDLYSLWCSWPRKAR